MTTPVAPRAARGQVREVVQAQDLLDDGAAPVEPDVATMLASIQALQTRIAAMETEKGVPSDPVAAGVQNLSAHVTAKVNGSPQHVDDFAELKALLENNDGAVDRSAADEIRLAVEDAADRLRHLDLSYLVVLARNLQRSVLTRDKGATAPITPATV